MRQKNMSVVTSVRGPGRVVASHNTTTHHPLPTNHLLPVVTGVVLRLLSIVI
jgi:hypothetical protein